MIHILKPPWKRSKYILKFQIRDPNEITGHFSIFSNFFDKFKIIWLTIKKVFKNSVWIRKWVFTLDWFIFTQTRKNPLRCTDFVKVSPKIINSVKMTLGIKNFTEKSLFSWTKSLILQTQFFFGVEATKQFDWASQIILSDRLVDSTKKFSTLNRFFFCVQ